MTAAGALIGPYRILGPLGSGGMGEVFRAHDTKLGRDVALKLLPPAVARDAERRARFQREARMLAALHHPNIATIFGVDESSGVPALVMELVDGPTVADRLRGGALSMKEALSIARQLVDALDAAHEKGIVHRDLKPANIKITADGTVKVLDFGLARAMTADANAAPDLTTSLRSMPGVVLGTPAYMSPEQARGLDVDKRTDIWAFGAVLYEMLTGKPAFDGATLSDIIASVLSGAPDLDALPASAPPHVRTLLARCLEKDQKRRLRDIWDARADLDEAPAVVAAGGRRSNAPVVAVVVLLASAAATLGWWIAVGRHPSASPGFAGGMLQPITSDPGYSGEPALSPDGRLLAFSSDRAGRGDFDIWVQQVDGGTPLRLTDDPSNDRRPDFSPDGSQIVFRSERNGGGVYIVPALGGPARLLAAGGRDPKFSPDGTRIAYWTGQFRARAIGGSETYVLPLTGGPPVRVMAGFVTANSPVWSPDGQSLLVVGRRSEEAVSELDWWRVPAAGGPAERTGLAGWRDLRTSLVQDDNIGIGQWTREGFLLDLGSNLWMLPLSAAGRLAGEPRQLTLGSAPYGTSSMSRDGLIVLSSVTLNRNIMRAPLSAPLPPQVLYTDSNVTELRASTSRDGAVIVFERVNGRRYEIWTKNTFTGEQHLIAQTPAMQPVNATVSPDGTRVSYVLPRPDSTVAQEGDSFVVELSGGVPRSICRGCGTWGFLSDNRPVLTDRSRAIQILEGDRAHDIVVAPAGQRLTRPSVSPDVRTIAFRVEQGATAKTYVARFSESGVPRSRWTQIDEPTTTGRPCGWSPDSSLLYLLLDADGARDLWGQKIADGTPVGKPFVVRHLHDMIAVSTSLGNAVSTQGFVFESGSVTGNIWRLVPDGK